MSQEFVGLKEASIVEKFSSARRGQRALPGVQLRRAALEGGGYVPLQAMSWPGGWRAGLTCLLALQSAQGPAGGLGPPSSMASTGWRPLDGAQGSLGLELAFSASLAGHGATQVQRVGTSPLMAGGAKALWPF